MEEEGREEGQREEGVGKKGEMEGKGEIGEGEVWEVGEKLLKLAMKMEEGKRRMKTEKDTGRWRERERGVTEG